MNCADITSHRHDVLLKKLAAKSSKKYKTELSRGDSPGPVIRSSPGHFFCAHQFFPQHKARRFQASMCCRKHIKSTFDQSLSLTTWLHYANEIPDVLVSFRGVLRILHVTSCTSLLGQFLESQRPGGRMNLVVHLSDSLWSRESPVVFKVDRRCLGMQQGIRRPRFD